MGILTHLGIITALKWRRGGGGEQQSTMSTALFRLLLFKLKYCAEHKLFLPPRKPRSPRRPYESDIKEETEANLACAALLPVLQPADDSTL